MHTVAAPEAPTRLTAWRSPSKGEQPTLAWAVVTGAEGTTATAQCADMRDASQCAQETFWRATAEGAYQ